MSSRQNLTYTCFLSLVLDIFFRDKRSYLLIKKNIMIIDKLLKRQNVIARKKLNIFGLSKCNSSTSTPKSETWQTMISGSKSWLSNLRFNRSAHYQNESHVIRDVYTHTGAINDIPKWYRLGIVKIVANIVFFICVGSFISKSAVTFLEVNDIFKPEDDDDDEDDD